MMMVVNPGMHNFPYGNSLRQSGPFFHKSDIPQESLENDCLYLCENSLQQCDPFYYISDIQ
ncbi:hypothetical protein C1H46_029675 [Malus baccata]|uniref:Uncharacterized protein n=1 Tax=Malus baccata TaxID=106549 RepID=A0A540LEH3_MALBA|nr:hypothetical protein C1H46_029675 [Malus baccata]